MPNNGLLPHEMRCSEKPSCNRILDSANPTNCGMSFCPYVTKRSQGAVVAAPINLDEVAQELFSVDELRELDETLEPRRKAS